MTSSQEARCTENSEGTETHSHGSKIEADHATATGALGERGPLLVGPPLCYWVGEPVDFIVSKQGQKELAEGSCEEHRVAKAAIKIGGPV